MLSSRVTTKEQEFFDIFTKIQKLCHLSDETAQDPTVQRHLKLMSNMVYFYRREGALKVKDAVRAKWLESKGVAVLKAKRKK